MARFVIRRLGAFGLILLLISLLIFSLLASLGVDPAAGIFASDEEATMEDYLQLRRLYGLDDPLPLKYAKWATSALRGDFGYSQKYKQPVAELIAPRLNNTLILAGAAMIIAVMASVLLGIYSATHQYSPGDYVTMCLTFIGFSVPSFWLGLMLIILFGVTLGALPTGGAYTLAVGGQSGSVWSELLDRARHLILPVSVLAFHSMAEFTRYIRSSMLDVVVQDYVRTARAKGMPERVVLGKHALKNAVIPFVTVAAWSLPRLLGGSIAIETVFTYPGIGRLLYDAVLAADFNLAVVLVMLMAVFVVAANLVADILYAYLDPRIQYA